MHTFSSLLALVSVGTGALAAPVLVSPASMPALTSFGVSASMSSVAVPSAASASASSSSASGMLSSAVPSATASVTVVAPSLSTFTSTSSISVAALAAMPSAPAPVSLYRPSSMVLSAAAPSSTPPATATTAMLSAPTAAVSAASLDLPAPHVVAPAGASHETDTAVRARLLAYASSLLDETSALSPASLQQTLSAFEPELDALSARYSQARQAAGAAGLLHAPYGGTAPGARAMGRSLYALRTHLAKAGVDDAPAQWEWYTAVLVHNVREQMLWLIDDHIALEHLMRAAPTQGTAHIADVQSPSSDTSASSLPAPTGASAVSVSSVATASGTLVAASTASSALPSPPTI